MEMRQGSAQESCDRDVGCKEAQICEALDRSVLSHAPSSFHLAFRVMESSKETENCVACPLAKSPSLARKLVIICSHLSMRLLANEEHALHLVRQWQLANLTRRFDSDPV